MARTQNIDRNKLLLAAEEIVIRDGAAALTIAAVADALSISKGGVQSCYASKELLILALLDRWMKEEKELFDRECKDKDSLKDRILAHSKVTRDGDSGNARSASLLIALLQSTQHLDLVRGWYKTRLSDLASNHTKNPNLMLAFLATEGAYYLKYFGLFEFDTNSWNEIFKNIQTLANKNADVKGSS